MVRVNFTIPDSNIDLWWPNGYGEQILYRLKLGYADESIEKLIGFRYIQNIQNTSIKLQSVSLSTTSIMDHQLLHQKFVK